MRKARAIARAQTTPSTTTTVGKSVSSNDAFDAKISAMKSRASKGESEDRANARSNASSDVRRMAGTPLASTLAEASATTGEGNRTNDEDDGVMSSMAVRVGSFIAACALAIVFVPTDLMFAGGGGGGARRAKGLSESAKEEVVKQASAVEDALALAPGDVDKLKQAAQSYLVLDDYPKALPFLERLVAADPSEENVSALAETWIADGQPSRAVEVFRTMIDVDVLGKDARASTPSSSLLRGYLDALGKAGRNGLALDYAKTFAKKGWVDEIDAQLLEARVYSSWKGHGKDAEAAYERVVNENPGDFRGYLAQGVFFRTAGKPDAAENAFRKAKSLAPADTAAVVNQVIAASKSSERL